MVTYQFGPFLLDPVKRLLLKDGEPVQLPPKALETLLILVQNSGRVVEKAELIDRLWPDSFVEEINLTVYISALRKVLGESPDEHRYIVTVPRRGYSFVHKVSELCESDAAAPGVDEPIDQPLEKLTHSVVDAAATTEDTIPLNDSKAPVSTSSHSTQPAVRKIGRVYMLAIGISVALAISLVWLFISAGSPRKLSSMAGKSIAVLPFKMIGAQEQEYLEFGMADALITRLSRLEQTIVRPTSSIFNYVGKNYDPIVAGRELGVDAVMQGTIQQAGGRVRVTLQLISTADGNTIWADRFDERAMNILAVQDSISAQVTQALSEKLSSSDTARLATEDTSNTEAYDAYLKGIFFWNKRSRDALKKSVEYFQQAADLDPNYARAYAGLADAAALAASLIPDKSEREQYVERAKVAAAKAVEIGDPLAEAHIARSLVYMICERDARSAEREQMRALELAPNNAIAHQRYGWILFQLGQLERSAQEMKLAVELDPLAIVNHVARSNVLYYLGQYDEAIQECEKALELDPTYDAAAVLLGLACEQKREYDRAIAELERSAQGAKDDVEILEALGHVYAVSGRAAKAQRIIQQLEALTDKQAAAIYGIALIYVGMNDKDRAFQWLEKGARAKAPLRIRLRLDPRLANVRYDKRFDEFLRLLAR